MIYKKHTRRNTQIIIIRILIHSPFCVLKFTASAPHKRFSSTPLLYILGGKTFDHSDDMQFPLKKNECPFLPGSTGCLPSNYV